MLYLTRDLDDRYVLWASAPTWNGHYWAKGYFVLDWGDFTRRVNPFEPLKRGQMRQYPAGETKDAKGEVAP
jgi:hypothetical protein